QADGRAVLRDQRQLLASLQLDGLAAVDRLSGLECHAAGFDDDEIGSLGGRSEAERDDDGELTCSRRESHEGLRGSESWEWTAGVAPAGDAADRSPARAPSPTRVKAAQ